MAVMVPSEGKDLLHLMLSDNFAVGRASALTHEQTDTCAPFPAVTMATLTGRGILSARGGRYGQRGVALPSPPTPVPHLLFTHKHTHVHANTRGESWCLAHTEKGTCATQANKNKLKWTHKHVQSSTNYTHKCRHLLLTSAPWRQTQPPSHCLSRPPFLLLTYCLQQTKRHIPP